MHWFLMGLLGCAAFLWLVECIDIAFGTLSIPALKSVAPLKDSECPNVSILFAARDEEEKLPSALSTFLSQNYPDYEIVAVDDRSVDATATILEAAAKKNPRLKIINVASLPVGWLGKPHALQKAFENSAGDWLVFTDADVHFEHDVLRYALALAEKMHWDHMPMLCETKMFSVGEKIAMTFLGMAFLIGMRPWRVSNPKSTSYIGIGAFQLIRRSVYEKIDAHRRLAMEVVDDVKLGKLVKEAGFRSGIAKAGTAVSVYWHSGVRNIVRGTTKNFFATTGFRLWLVCIQILGLFVLSVLPWVALPFVHGWARAFASVAVVCSVLAEGGVAWELDISPIYALTHPIGALLFAWMLTRSTIVTLRQGGIEWRGTFYPLEELKRGIV
ncbi:MAG: glycosyltransferase family 2 protein [Candidatus Acidiferrales bacterium]